MTTKIRENRLRRMAERQGLGLLKSRRRDPHANDFGRFMIYDAEKNYLVAGGWPVSYSLDLDDVEDFLTNPPTRRSGEPRAIRGTR